MKPKNRPLRFFFSSTVTVAIGTLVALPCLVLLASHSAQAANGADTWTGASATWNTAGNWTGTNTPPISGDSFIFGAAGTGGLRLNNNLTSSAFSIAGITFNAGAEAFVIGNGTTTANAGNTFVLTGSVINNSTSLETINNPFSMTAVQTFTTTAGGGNITLGGIISGSGGGITKTGLGTLSLSQANSYTGGTNLNGGVVSISGSNNALGTTGTLSFGGGTLQYTSGITPDLSARFGTVSQAYSIDTNGQSVTFGTAFGGTGSNGNTLTKTGAGTLTLSQANTYTGGTTLSGTGMLSITNANALGTNKLYLKSTQTGANTTLGISGGIAVATPIEMDSTTGREWITTTGTGNNSLTGGITITGASTNTFVIDNHQTSGNLTISGGISGASYKGWVSLRGNLAGAMGFLNGVVNLSSDTNTALSNGGTTDWTINAVGSSYSSTRFNGGTGSIILGADNGLATNAQVVWDGTASSTWGKLDMAGFSASVAGLNSTVLSTTSSAYGNVTNTGTSDSTLTLASLLFSRTFNGTITDGTTNKISLVMNSAGKTQILAGTNTYSGATTVKAGTLALGASGTFASSPTIVVGDTGSSGAVLDLTAKTTGFALSSGQTLMGIGTVNYGTGKQLINNGILAPGNSVGTLSITGDYSFGSTSIYQVELGAGVNNADKIAISGAATIVSGARISFTTLTAPDQGKYVLATAASGLASPAFTLSGSLPTNYSLLYSATELDLQHKATIALSLGTNASSVRVGIQTVNLSIGNTAPTGAADLSYTLGGVTGSAGTRAAAAGSSAATGTYTAIAGVNSFNITATDANATNSPQSVAFSPTGYNLASAATSQTVNLYTRPGVAVSKDLSLTNTAAASATYQENLGTTGFAGTTTGFTASGSATGIAGGASGSGSLSVGVTSGVVGSAGIYSGSTTLGLQTEAVNSSGLGNLGISSQSVDIEVVVYDYATATFSKTGGAGSLSGSGTSYALNFGSGLLLDTDYTATFSLANGLFSYVYQDSLAGTYGTLSGAFATTATNFGNVASGGTDTFTVTFRTGTTGTTGTYSSNLTFDGTSNNSQLGDSTLAGGTINISLNAVAIPEPRAALLGGLGMPALLRRRNRKWPSVTKSPIKR